MTNTTDQDVAEKIGRAIDGQIFRLQAEKDLLTGAGPRIAAINAELAGLQLEKTRIDARRPPVVPGPPLSTFPGQIR